MAGLASPSGDRILAQCAALAACSESDGALTRRYLTPQHRDAAALIAGWMREAGMQASLDALGNVVGRYDAGSPGAPLLITGSHMDSVVNAGRYDGILGILCAIEAVRSLSGGRERLPFAIEVVAFGDEEGVRFGFSMIGSRALAGRFDAGWLERRDGEGVSLREALVAFGGDPAAIGSLARRRDEVVAFVELHIEQGPVLLDEGLALGVVTSIAGATRVALRVKGLAGHAGTVPMGARHDALAAAAEMVLAIEAHARRSGGALVATVGKLEVVGGGAINVIPGEVAFSLDLRAGDDATREAGVAAIDALTAGIAAQRGVARGWTPLFELSAAPCDARIQALLAESIAAQGIAPRRLPSGAGHDAMEMARLAPMGMLFVRCGAGGISHHPDETVEAADVEVATRVLVDFLHRLAAVPGTVGPRLRGDDE